MAACASAGRSRAERNRHHPPALAVSQGRVFTPSSPRGCPALPPHPPARGSEVVFGQLGEADELVTLRPAGVPLQEKRDVRIGETAFGDRIEAFTEDLGLGEADDAGRRVESRAETFPGEMVEKGAYLRRRGTLRAGPEIPPEDGQKAIGPESGGEKKPEETAPWVPLAQGAHGRD